MKFVGRGIQKLEPQHETQTRVFCSCDLDLDPMILINVLEVSNLKMYQYTKNEVSRSKLSKLRAQTGPTDGHTDRRD